jgi:ATP-dependent protease Clp ATPase subunit
MVLQLAGTCSFCGKDRREVFGIAGVVARWPRICDECIGLCFDILAEELEERARASGKGGPRSTGDDELDRLLSPATPADPREIIQRIQAHLQAPPRKARVRDLHCSFCDRSRQDVRKLIAGPRVFICDDCTADAAGLLSASGWRASG